MKNVSAKIFWLCIFLGVVIRFVLTCLGHNFDFDSYCIVGELVAQGKNVYANTSRYNYGPVWFMLLGVFWRVASLFTHNIMTFRIFIVSALTLVDLLIARVISRKAGNFWGIIFFLNPISLIITGYHNQFDNIAVLLGAYAVLSLEDSCNEHAIKANDIYGIILMSLSLITKHILWAFPIWILLNRNIDGRKKFLYAFIPPLMFLLNFTPYWSEGAKGIIRNVFLYKSFNNFPLLALDAMNRFGIYLPFQKYICLPLFGLLMSAGAYMFRREKFYDSFLLYTISLVCFSSAIANQYIAIPCMAIIIMMRRKSAFYSALGLMFLSCNSSGLHIPSFLQKHYNIDLGIVCRILSDGRINYPLFSWSLLAYLANYYFRMRRKN